MMRNFFVQDIAVLISLAGFADYSDYDSEACAPTHVASLRTVIIEKRKTKQQETEDGLDDISIDPLPRDICNISDEEWQ
jgi:hypothetical protein